MDRAPIIVRRSRPARSGNQKDSVGRGGHVFFPRALRVPAERAGQLASRFRNLAQAAHRFTHQRHRWNSQIRRKRAVSSHNSARPVVHHDVIGDRVDVLHPLSFGPLQLREALKILERKRRVTRQCLQKPLFLGPQRCSFSEQTQRSQLFFFARRDSHKNRSLRPFDAG